jgi:hypothetical protein
MMLTTFKAVSLEKIQVVHEVEDHLGFARGYKLPA